MDLGGTSICVKNDVQTRLTPALEAAQALRGRRAVHARTSEAFTEAIDAFRRAIASDSSYAPAYAELAAAYGLSITYAMEMELTPYERFREALALTTRARAVALLPNSADMRGWYAHSLARAGRHEEGGIDSRFYEGGLYEEVRAVEGHEDRVATIWQAAWERVSGEAD